MKKIVFMLTLVSLVAIGCKNKPKQEENKTVVSTEENIKKSSFKISGMTCEIGCVKKIQSDLSKKDGVIDAKVVLKDSLATIKYDATKIDKAGLATFIEGIADGKTYQVTKISDVKSCAKSNASAKGKKPCSPNCKKECGSKKKEGKQACKPDCKKKCEKAKATGKKPCSPNCTKECGSKKKEGKQACKPDCKKKCETAKATGKKPCSPNCTKECGSKKKAKKQACKPECKKKCCA